MFAIAFLIYVLGAFIASALIIDREFFFDSDEADPLGVGCLSLAWPVIAAVVIAGTLVFAIGRVGEAIVNAVRRY